MLSNLDRAKKLRFRSRLRTVSMILFFSVAAFVGTRGVRAEEPETVPQEEALIERWNVVYNEIHDSLAFTIVGDSKESRALKSKVVLSQYNPTEAQGVRHGRIYVWLAKGKPAVVGGIWSIPDRANHQIRKICYEFHSLSRQSVRLEKNGTRIWQCDRPGVEWQQHRGKETPAASRTARLVQMRRISESYKTDFRLLPQPIYRYPDETNGVTDGAVFAYTKGTDPQTLLMLEARDDRWYVAFARSNKNARNVTYQDEVVWSVESIRANWQGLIRSDSDPFYLHFVVERRLAANPESVLVGQQ